MIRRRLRNLWRILCPRPIADPVLERVEAQEARQAPARPAAVHPTGNTELDPVTGREIPKHSEL